MGRSAADCTATYEGVSTTRWEATCRKPTAQIAEERGAVCAREWIDRHGRS